MDGIVGAAVPIVDPKGNVLAAVGMQGPLPRLTLRGVRGPSCRACDVLPSGSRACGSTDPG